MIVPLVQACQDPQLLGATLTLYPRQVELLEGLDGPETMHILSVGRQSGKSTLGQMAAVHNATLRPDLDSLMPRGRTRYILVAAPGMSQAEEFIRGCSAMVDASPALRSLAAVRVDRIDFELSSGARTAIRALPAISRNVRGMSASMIICDEFSHFSDTAGPGSDTMMLEALEPSARIFGNAAKILLLSTPFGEQGRFYELFMAASNGLLPNARAVTAPVWEVDTSLDEAWRERKRAEVGEDHFRQEYAAEFVGSGGAFMDLRGLEYAPGPAPPEAASSWVGSLDPAFAQDSFGYAVLGQSSVEPGQLICGPLGAITPGGRLRSLGQRRSREDVVLERVWRELEPYAAEGLKLLSDIHMGDAVSSYFERRGVPTTIQSVSGPVMTQQFTSLRARLMDGSLRLWRCEQLIEELRRVRAGRNTEQVVLARFKNSHSDIAAALAMGCWDLRWVGEEPDSEARMGRSAWGAEVRDALDPVPSVGGSVTPALTAGLLTQQL